MERVETSENILSDIGGISWAAPATIVPIQVLLSLGCRHLRLANSAVALVVHERVRKGRLSQALYKLFDGNRK